MKQKKEVIVLTKNEPISWLWYDQFLKAEISLNTKPPAYKVMYLLQHGQSEDLNYIYQVIEQEALGKRFRVILGNRFKIQKAPGKKSKIRYFYSCLSELGMKEISPGYLIPDSM